MNPHRRCRYSRVVVGGGAGFRKMRAQGSGCCGRREKENTEKIGMKRLYYVMFVENFARQPAVIVFRDHSVAEKYM